MPEPIKFEVWMVFDKDGKPFKFASGSTEYEAWESMRLWNKKVEEYEWFRKSRMEMGYTARRVACTVEE